MNRDRVPFLILLVILELSLVLGCGRDRGDSPQAAVGTETSIPVTVTRAAAKNITTFMSSTGKIRAIQDLTICSKIGGILQEVLFEEGDPVEEDQALAKVEDEEYLLAVRESEAGLFSARSNLAKTRQLSRPQEIDAARATFERAQADASMARITWERRKQLYERQIISKQEYDLAEMDYKAKMASRNAAKEQLDLVEEGARSEDIEMASSRVKQAEAKLSLAKKRLKDTRIKSPFRGIITRRMVDPGDLVALGTPIANLVDVERVETKVGVTEKDLTHVRSDSKVVATVVAYPRRIFHGRIVFIGLKADDATGTFPVKIEFDNPSGLLKPGMVAEVQIEKEIYQEVILIPQDAVLDKMNRKVVFVIENDRSLERSIELGPLVGEEAIIQNGLTVGETFVIIGQQSLKNGSRVRIERTL